MVLCFSKSILMKTSLFFVLLFPEYTGVFSIKQIYRFHLSTIFWFLNIVSCSDPKLLSLSLVFICYHSCVYYALKINGYLNLGSKMMTII